MVLLLLMTVSAVSCNSSADRQRYRGDYTLGHEVNTFCPQISSRCYWLDPDTDGRVRDRLEQIFRDKSPGLYQPVCVIITGNIDRDSERTGFAVDTDGLITVTRVHGECNSSRIVTQGDLQHHRWVLRMLDYRPIRQKEWPVLPVLDFGERLFVEGGDGCRKFNGFAKLTGDRIEFNGFEFEHSRCGADHSDRGLFSIAGAWEIGVEDSQYLILENAESRLIFERDDWR